MKNKIGERIDKLTQKVLGKSMVDRVLGKPLHLTPKIKKMVKELKRKNA